MIYSYIKHLFLFLLFLSSYHTSFSQCIGTEGQVTWSYWRNLPAANFEELYSSDRFPNGPDGVRAVNSLASPRNFDNGFGGQVKGYIRVPSSGEVIFKVTGYDRAQFLLSTDGNPANASLVASAIAYNDSPTQTTAPILLQANQNYYFELAYTEIGSIDLAKVEWKTTFLEGLSTVNWLVITSEYLADVCTNPCTDRGTPCDDGNAQTINDQADGNCNCVGDPITTNTCVGERNILQPYIYEGIEGVYNIPLSEQLSTADNYPDAPDRLQPLRADWYDKGQYAQSETHNYGVRIQAYLSVPVTGNYSFNTTGTRATLFYLSSDDTEANKTANSIRANGWLDNFEHDESAEQTLTDVYLEAGKYYYTEFLHRSNSFYSSYSLFWKGPQHTGDTWRRMPTFYFFDYTCETACLKNGVACNDNNPLTANDQWDGACNCAGTPCTGPEDCDDLTAFYPSFDACETTMQVDNRAADAWLSCAPLSPNPNAARDGNHWIQYNFGETYSLSNIHVWNYNVADATDLGFEQVVIDYSNDGIHWQELGNYTWNVATGLGKYGGFDLPNMPTITAQHVLITSLDPITTCRGLSKVAFTAAACPDIAFSTITDGQEFSAPANPTITITPTGENIEISNVALYIGDLLVSTLTAPPYTWAGTSAVSNLPEGAYTLRAVTTDAEGMSCSASLQINVKATNEVCESGSLSISRIEKELYQTNQTIQSTATVPATTSTEFVAAESITLASSFHAVAGSAFIARIEDCMPNSIVAAATDRRAADRTNALTVSSTLAPISTVQIYPNPVQTDFTVAFEAAVAGMVSIDVYTVAGKVVRNLSYQKSVGQGIYTLRLSADALVSGLYYCKVRIGEEVWVESFVKGVF